jgi:hypothetical protein
VRDDLIPCDPSIPHRYSYTMSIGIRDEDGAVSWRSVVVDSNESLRRGELHDASYEAYIALQRVRRTDPRARTLPDRDDVISFHYRSISRQC